MVREFSPPTPHYFSQLNECVATNSPSMCKSLVLNMSELSHPHSLSINKSRNSNTVPHAQKMVSSATIDKRGHVTPTQVIQAGLLNARSVCNKGEAILDFIESNKLSMLLVSETWLTGLNVQDQVIIKTCSPHNYKCFNWSRSCRKGGGLLLLCDEALQIKEVTQTECQFACAFELAIFQIMNGKDTVTCALIYRPPNFKLSLFYPSFVKLCEWFLKYDRILIAGDFNLPSNQISENTQFHSILVSFGLLQLVKQSRMNPEIF
jgi:hypothetical protein